MKLIKSALVMAVAVLMMSCGGKTNTTGEGDGSATQADSTANERVSVPAMSYSNETLGYQITYPKDVFELQAGTENTDEQVFLPKEGKAKLRIYKDERKDKSGKVLTYNEAFEIDRATSSKRQVAYNSLRPTFYAISGVEGNEIFYQKTIMAKGNLVTAKLTYTKEEKPTYDAMIASLFDSFR